MELERRKPWLFYGWWIVGSCLVMSLYTTGVLGYGFTAVIDPLIKEFGWSSAEISFASSLRGVEAGLFAPVIGIIIDRFGAKPVLFIGGIITGLSMILLSRVNSLVEFYIVFGLIAIGTSALGVTTFQAAVANWFRRRMGMAMGVMVSGFGFSGLIVIPAARVIDAFGWRLGMIYMGIGVFIIVLPLTLLIRNHPEDYGLSPDGDTGTGDRTAVPSALRGHNGKSGDKSVSVRQALSSRTFWLISIAMAAQFLVCGGVITHMMPYMSSIGYSREIGSVIAAALPLTSIAGRLVFGWLGDRVKNKTLTIAGFIMMATGMFCFALAAGGVFVVVLFLTIFGTGYGSITTLRAILPRTYFGSKGYGTFMGLITGVGTLGSMLGAPLAGWCFDLTGSYQPIWLIYAGVCAVSFFLIALIPSLKVEESEVASREASIE